MVKNRVRNRQRVSRGTTVLGTVHARAHTGDGTPASDSTRRPSRRSSLSEHRSYRRARPRSFQFPRSPSSRSERTERTLARHAQRRPSFIARPSFLAPRSSRKPFHLALHLLRLIPCLIELFPGRIGLAPSSRPRPPLSTSVKLRSELRPSRRRPPPGLPPRKIDPR